MKVQNCTLDTRTLIATLPSGARAVLRLGPGEVSKDFEPEVFEILRSNQAVNLLFKNRLICEYPLKPKPSKPQAKLAKTAPAKSKKPKPKKLDLGV
ncbi:MAG: hypothetical protein KAT00_11635 [Planctomycetes bacterium]|nr:hypothetical protein [Planctomycetota bacterium]